MTSPRISIVVAVGRDGQHNRVIGKDNKLLWHIPDDLKRFKSITLGHPIIMGQKTFESIVLALGKALPGRTNIIITRDVAWSYPGVKVVHSLEEGIALAKELDPAEIFIGGGTEIYTESLPYVDRLYLTIIDAEKEGDSFFPDYSQFVKTFDRERREHDGLSYEWLTLER